MGWAGKQEQISDDFLYKSEAGFISILGASVPPGTNMTPGMSNPIILVHVLAINLSNE